MLPRLRRRSRRWLSDIVGLPIKPSAAPVGRGSLGRGRRRSRPERWADAVQTLADMLGQFQEWRGNLPSRLETARQRKRLTPCWSCAVMLKIFRPSRCQKASDGTDGAHQWHCETRFLCVQRIDPASRGHRSEALRQSKGTGLAASGPFSNRVCLVKPKMSSFNRHFTGNRYVTKRSSCCSPPRW